MSVVFTRRKTPGFTGFCGKAPPGGPSGGPQCVALQVQRLGAVRLRDAGVADQHVSQTAMAPSSEPPPCVVSRVGFYILQTSCACAPATTPGRHHVLTRACSRSASASYRQS